MKLLTFSTLFPNAAQPRHGSFVAERLAHLLDHGGLTSTVMAPVPWLPRFLSRSAHYGVYARVPAQERHNGLEVHHPRYPVLPRIGMNIAPWLMYAAVSGAVRRLHRRERLDLIDAHYFYPDGVVAAWLGRRLGLPVVITARGSDVNLLPEFAVPRRLILQAARSCAAVITVSAALKERLVALGVAPARVTVLRNGVDLARFAPQPRDAVRTQLDVHGPTLLMVGNLVAEKGHALALEALSSLPEVHLLIVGDGPLAGELRTLVGRLGLHARVRFEGAVPQQALTAYYNAADALVLASTREGMPNVMLESLACGTPVAAVPVGGVPEVIAAPPAGILAGQRSPAALAGAIRGLLADLPDRAATRSYAMRFAWEETVHGQLELFDRVISAQRHMETA